ncbi:MAG TPA: LacI family DNA-binding transcriptional regulator [Armatimonadota bacterium]|jgi:LacI family transcriptional regulator
MPTKRPSQSVTLQAIAERCGVHFSTVSLAMRNDPRLRQDTITKIQTTAAEMGYDASYSDSARRMALRKHGKDIPNYTIGVVMPRSFLNITYYLQIYRGLLSVLTDANYSALTLCMDNTAHNSIPLAFRRGDIDGIVAYTSPEVLLSLVHQLREIAGFKERPIVINQAEWPDMLHVDADDGQGAYASACHLFSQGHRHLFMNLFRHLPPSIGGPASRIHAVTRAMHEYGIDPQQHLHLLPTPSHWLDPYSKLDDPSNMPRAIKRDDARPIVRYLRAHPEITAVLAVNDASARQLWHILTELGRRVPDDVSLIGFDDTDPILDADGKNLLTTVRMPLYEMGRQAALLILRQLQGDTADAETQIVLPTEFILRHSTAPCQK